MEDKIALIDADSLIYISCYNKDDNLKTLEECKNTADEFIKNILDATKTSKFLLFLTIGKGFRYKVYTEYKANRKDLKPLAHYVEVRQYLIDKYKAYNHPELEADDLCLIYSKKLPNSFISSPDKDVLMLEGRHYNYKKHKWVKVNKDEADNHFWTSMVTGDVIDNIKGIPGKGEKYAEKSLEFCNEFERSPDKYCRSIAIYRQYLHYYGEHEGIKQFHQNYSCLKIVDEWPDIPDLSAIDYNKINEYQEENNR